MTSKNLIREVQRLGGQVVNDKHFGDGLIAVVNGYDVEYMGNNCDFYTVRSVNKRGYYDAGSDYNPCGYSYYTRIKDLERAVRI